MDITQFFDFISTLDINLKYYIQKYDIWVYVLLFLVVYAKTGFVITTFLPGDTLVFASGTLASIGQLNIWILILCFFVAALLGDNQNYCIGKTFRMINQKSPFLNRLIPEVVIEKAHNFLEKYGKVAITFSRFIPLMRTTLPFISGYTKFPYWLFVLNNMAGAVLWTTLWLGTGYLLGNITWVEKNLFLTLLLISAIAIAPSIVGFIKQYNEKSTT